MNRPFTIDIKEAARYLGYRNQSPDDATLGMILRCVDLIWEKADFRYVMQPFSLDIQEEELHFAGLSVASKSLLRNLKDCHQVLLFAATLGVGMDRLLERYARTDVAMAVTLQACAAAAVESYCDYLETIWKEEQNVFFRPRFSPGYGDFPLEYQKDFLRILDAPKKIGLTLTDSLMMVPVKSVTALIGVSPISTGCHKSGCESCGKTDCMYRR